jgi:hypothetical protein
MNRTVWNKRRTPRRMISILAMVGLVVGTLAVTAAPASAATPSVSVSASVSGTTARITYTVNRQHKAVESRVCTLDSASANCGNQSSTTKKTTTYKVVLTGLDPGRHAFAVIVRLTDGGSASGSTSFSIAGCVVRNLTLSVSYTGTGSNLQTAIDAATSRDTLQIRGLCVGNFTVATNLKLVGKPMVGYPKATLDGNDAGRVLFVGRVNVTIDSLAIKNGRAPFVGPGLFGGGIFNDGALTLNGSSSVSGSTAAIGGGIANDGTLTLNDSSSVTGNTADDGGGIANYGVLRLNDFVSVSGNTATFELGGGGGIANFGNSVAVLSDSSSVSRNQASSGYGGGIYSAAPSPSRTSL